VDRLSVNDSYFASVAGSTPYGRPLAAKPPRFYGEDGHRRRNREPPNLQISHRLGLSKKIVLDKTPPADAAVRPL
jgi:hypothetical protein